MKSNLQDACLELGICVIDKAELGSFIVYGLPEVKVCDMVHDALELALENGFTHQNTVITDRARVKRDENQ